MWLIWSQASYQMKGNFLIFRKIGNFLISKMKGNFQNFLRKMIKIFVKNHQQPEEKFIRLKVFMQLQKLRLRTNQKNKKVWKNVANIENLLISEE